MILQIKKIAHRHVLLQVNGNDQAAGKCWWHCVDDFKIISMNVN